MSTFAELYSGDLHRINGNKKGYEPRFLYFYRKAQTCKYPILSQYFRLRYRWIRFRHGIEISPAVKIGKGLYIGHPYNITINEDAVLGENCNIAKGVTIGVENRGKRKGVPTIGNCVWIGVNSTVVGNIIIGDDVLIAPNSLVNCDVPSHSVVYGNPCLIKHRDNATEYYVENKA